MRLRLHLEVRILPATGSTSSGLVRAGCRALINTYDVDGYEITKFVSITALYKMLLY